MKFFLIKKIRNEYINFTMEGREKIEKEKSGKAESGSGKKRRVFTFY